jgi:superfamily I DNA and/or RNA helicase
MYKGQLVLFRRLVKEASSMSIFTNESLDDVRMTTTDNYQGEESDIVRLVFSPLLRSFYLQIISFR